MRYLILLLVFFSSCQSHRSSFLTINSEKVKEINLPLTSFDKNVLYDDNFAVIDNRQTLITFFNDYQIAFYDLDSLKIFHTINLNKELLGFHFVNKDSIFLFFSNACNWNNYYDSTLVLVDYYGNPKKYYSFSNSDVPIWNDNTKNNANSLSPTLFFNPLLYSQQKIFFFLTFYGKDKNFDLGTDSFDYYKHPVISYYDLKTEKLVVNNKIWYPHVPLHTKYPRYLNDFRRINYCLLNNKLLVQFYYSNSFYVWDFQKNTTQQKYTKSRIIDTILPLKKDKEIKPWETINRYSGIYYDPYRNLVCRNINLSEDYGYEPIVQLLDTNLNYIGETVNLYLNNTSIFLRDYLLYPTPSLKKGYFNIDFYKISTTKSNIDSVKQTLDIKVKKYKEKHKEKFCTIVENSNQDPQNILTYIHQKATISDSNLTVVSIWSEGCPGCVEDILSFFQKEKDMLNNYPCYLLLSAPGKIKADAIINKYNLITYKRLLVDTANEYFNYLPFNNISSPRLTIIKNNIIINDTIYLPDKFELLKKRLLDFYEAEAE